MRALNIGSLLTLDAGTPLEGFTLTEAKRLFLGLEGTMVQIRCVAIGWICTACAKSSNIFPTPCSYSTVIFTCAKLMSCGEQRHSAIDRKGVLSEVIFVVSSAREVEPSLQN